MSPSSRRHVPLISFETMAEDSVGQASHPWTYCKWAKSFVQELHALYQSSTLVGDKERSFESLVEPLRAILVPVAASVDDPEFTRGAEKVEKIRAYLRSVQNTMSRHGGAAIADHCSLGSQQNPGPVMVCSPVSTILVLAFRDMTITPSAYMTVTPGGRRDRPDSRDRLGQSCRHYVRSDWSGHLHVGHVGPGGRQGVHPTDCQVNTIITPS